MIRSKHIVALFIMLCKIKTCKNKVHARRLCHKHYMKWLSLNRGRKKELCFIPNCENRTKLNWLCEKHYRRIKKLYQTGERNLKPSNGVCLDWLKSCLAKNTDRCLLFPFVRSDNGYARIYYEGKLEYAHRLVATWVCGMPPKYDYQAAHICGNGHMGCCNPKHLYWATRTQNSEDSRNHGTMAIGESVGTSKLTEYQVKKIREGLLEGERQIELAQKFGVSRKAIYRIKKRHLWAHV